MATTPVVLPGNSHGLRSWRAIAHGDRKELYTTKRLSLTHSLTQFGDLLVDALPRCL